MKDSKESQLKVVTLLSEVVANYLRLSEEFCESEHQKKITDVNFLFNLMCKALVYKEMTGACSAGKHIGGFVDFVFETQDICLFLYGDCTSVAQVRRQKHSWIKSPIEIKTLRHELPEGANRRVAKLYNKIEHAVMEAIK